MFKLNPYKHENQMIVASTGNKIQLSKMHLQMWMILQPMQKRGQKYKTGQLDPNTTDVFNWAMTSAEILLNKIKVIRHLWYFGSHSVRRCIMIVHHHSNKKELQLNCKNSLQFNFWEVLRVLENQEALGKNKVMLVSVRTLSSLWSLNDSELLFEEKTCYDMITRLIKYLYLLLQNNYLTYLKFRLALIKPE